jgi:hypothetical protein
MSVYHNLEISGVRCWRGTMQNVNISDAEVSIHGLGHFVVKEGVTNDEAEKIAAEFAESLYQEVIALIKTRIAGLKKARE